VGFFGVAKAAHLGHLLIRVRPSKSFLFGQGEEEKSKGGGIHEVPASTAQKLYHRVYSTREHF